MTLDVPPIETRELRARAAHENGVMMVHFAGSADSRSAAPIDELLSRLHGEAQRLAVSQVTIDFREFDFMNSSCFKAFVTWIVRAEELDAKQRYGIRFLSDANKHWQRRSLDALRYFAVELVSIES